MKIRSIWLQTWILLRKIAANKSPMRLIALTQATRKGYAHHQSAFSKRYFVEIIDLVVLGFEHLFEFKACLATNLESVASCNYESGAYEAHPNQTSSMISILVDS
jgi:hypothetical protein